MFFAIDIFCFIAMLDAIRAPGQSPWAIFVGGNQGTGSKHRYYKQNQHEVHFYFDKIALQTNELSIISPKE